MSKHFLTLAPPMLFLHDIVVPVVAVMFLTLNIEPFASELFEFVNLRLTLNVGTMLPAPIV